MTSKLRYSALGLLRLAIAGVSLVWAGCLDLTPVTVAQTAGPVDASARSEACSACLRGTDGGAGCKDEYTACSGVPVCSAMVTCAEEQGCFLKTSKEVVGCGLPCARDAGVMTSSDDVIGQANLLYSCMVKVCGSVCFDSDAGVSDGG